MQLIISPCDISINERGATVSFMGGQIWLRSELASSLRPGKCDRLALDVTLRPVSAGDRHFDALFVRGLSK